MDERHELDKGAHGERGKSDAVMCGEMTSGLKPRERIPRHSQRQEPTRAVKPFGIAKRVEREHTGMSQPTESVAGIDGESIDIVRPNYNVSSWGCLCLSRRIIAWHSPDRVRHRVPSSGSVVLGSLDQRACID
jgi:hypothetical protein